MATVLIAKNITSGPAVSVVLGNLGVTVPASGQVTLTDVQLFVDEILADPELQDAVSNDEIVLNDGSIDLPKDAVLGWGVPAASSGATLAGFDSSSVPIVTSGPWLTALTKTVPRDGDWLVRANAIVFNNNNNGVAQIAIRKNAEPEIPTSIVDIGDTVENSYSTAAALTLVAGDIVDFRFQHESGSGSSEMHNRNMTVQLVELF